jgi:hypothetical protein
VPSHLIIKCAEHRVLVGTRFHLKQTIVPLVHKSSEVIVAHLKGLEHAPVVEASIREADFVLLYDHPEKLPSLHQSLSRCELTLPQLHLGNQGRLETRFKRNEEFAVQGTEGTAIREAFESSCIVARLQEPFVSFVGAS